MSSPFLGAIVPVPFGFPPKGWATCSGQLLPINQNQALFSLLGTTYGGNGVTTFALPNLQSRVAIHAGDGFTLGQQGGEEAHLLTVNEIGAHSHAVTRPASDDAETTNRPDGAYFTAGGAYATAEDPDVPMGGTTTSAAGGSEPHTNVQPVAPLQFIIALQGIFPTQN
jgi:microcystin-dependent protein